jgi:hypothetical protein
MLWLDVACDLFIPEPCSDKTIHAPVAHVKHLSVIYLNVL